ncbi:MULTISPECIES: Mom family adenine methylcarbamoylation protein [unclassified Bradyrhizobium]
MSPTAKDIRVAPIAKRDADALIIRLHYSHKTVNNASLALGVFLNGRLEGAMTFGPSMDRSNIQGLVRETPWNGFLELNRLAFSEALPRNSESRALAIAMRMIRKNYPHIGWVISFADGCQCGDGTIYRASGFVLTGIKVNKSLLRLPEGSVTHKMTQVTGKNRAAHFASSMLTLCVV